MLPQREENGNSSQAGGFAKLSEGAQEQAPKSNTSTDEVNATHDTRAEYAHLSEWVNENLSDEVMERTELNALSRLLREELGQTDPSALKDYAVILRETAKRIEGIPTTSKASEEFKQFQVNNLYSVTNLMQLERLSDLLEVVKYFVYRFTEKTPTDE